MTCFTTRFGSVARSSDSLVYLQRRKEWRSNASSLSFLSSFSFLSSSSRAPSMRDAQRAGADCFLRKSRYMQVLEELSWKWSLVIDMQYIQSSSTDFGSEP